jgi:hypothetical protein
MVALGQDNDTKDLTRAQRPLVIHRKLVDNLVIDGGVPGTLDYNERRPHLQLVVMLFLCTRH